MEKAVVYLHASETKAYSLSGSLGFGPRDCNALSYKAAPLCSIYITTVHLETEMHLIIITQYE